MNTDDPHLLLRDFVAWVRRRRTIQRDAWLDEKTLEYVTQGIERFLEGKNPWPKPQGNKPTKDKMWECYYLTQFAEGDTPHMPQHTEERGAFTVVGDRLNISAKTVESHVRKARALVATEAGRIDFMHWISKIKGATFVRHCPADHPEALAMSGKRTGK